jgi:hypothetical protein
VGAGVSRERPQERGEGRATAVRTRIEVAGDDTAFPLQSAVEYSVSIIWPGEATNAAGLVDGDGDGDAATE